MSVIGPGNIQFSLNPSLSFNNPQYTPQPLTLTLTGAHVLTQAQVSNSFASGLILSLSGGADTVTTPTAEDIVALIDASIVKTGFVLTTLVSSVGASVPTLTGGAGVTILGTAAIAVGTSHILTLLLDNVTAGAEAVTIQVSA